MWYAERVNKLAVVSIVFVACGGSKPKPQPTPDVPQHDHPAPVKPAEPVPAPAPTPVAKGNPREDLIPRAVLFGNPERTGVQLSPDGKTLSWLAPKDGVLNVWIAPVGKLDQARAITNDTVRPIRTYFWAFTSKHILYQQDSGGDENFHVFRADLADGKVTDLTPFKGARAGISELSEKFPTTVIATINDRDPQVFDLYKIDLETGKRALLVQNDAKFIEFTVDNTLTPRLASRKTPDGATEILIAGQRDGKLAWQPWDKIPFEDAESSAVAAFTPDNKAVYFTETRGRDTGALVQVDLVTKKAKVLAEDAKADVGGMIFHPTKHTLQAVAFEYDRVHWKILDKSIQRDLAALAKLDGGEVSIGSRTLDDKTWIVTTTTELQGPRYYLWDRAKQQPTFLFAARPELATQPLVKMSPVTIKARDGLTLVSYLSLPKSADGPVPLVLLVHGGPWARDRWGFNGMHQLLANRGYAVLSVNYRGSTGFGKKFVNAANLQWSKTMHDDLLDAVKWAVDQKVTQKDAVCIAGGSYGGYATLVGLAMTPDVFRCGVDIVGPSNLMTLLSTVPAYWAPMIAVFHGRMGNPETPEGKALLTEASPLTHAAKITKPLLIAQGKNDPRVKESESEQIVAAMQHAGLAVTYAVFPDEGHGFARPENSIAFFAIMEAFLSAHLGGVYQPLTGDELKATSMQVKAGKAGIPGMPQ